MGMPAKHTLLLQRSGFPVPANNDLDPAERELLSRYGFWMEALASGELAPITPEQQHFVRVAGGVEQPQSAFERVWVKHLRTIQHGRSQAGPLELAACLERLQTARTEALTVQQEHTARRAAILEQVRPQLEALDAEFKDRLRVAGEEVAEREAEVREATLAFGASFRHAGIHAVYSRGRVTWDTHAMARYIETHPELAEFRKVGKPSVSLRFGPPSEPRPPRHPEAR